MDYDRKSSATLANGIQLSSPLLYAITVHIALPNKAMNTVYAQQRFFEAFSSYYSNTLRNQCTGKKRLRSRHKRDQPLVFLAFDMEGTRRGYKSQTVQCPHGHGLILFTERQLQNFLNRSDATRQADGSMTLTKPAGGISVIQFEPLPTSGDVEEFTDYALKHVARLSSPQENYRPYEWYPYGSQHYPFWKELSDERADQTSVERLRARRATDRILDTGKTVGEIARRSGYHPPA